MADALHAESRSRSQTPSVDTPSASIAPWAKEPAEAPRGPSLKEIQEAEAKVAAEQEAIVAEARRAALEREILAQAQTIAPAPGLPSSSTWASANPSPATPSSSATPSAWAKAATNKPVAVSSSTKTLAQIQKEEEARKKRQLAAAAVVAQTSAAVTSAALQSAGKRYADLASKVASPAPSPVVGGSAWTTVGASGKVKTPAPAPTPVAARAANPATTVPAVKKPAVTRTTTSGSGAAVNAQEEFKKWAVNELKHDLQKGMQGKKSRIITITNNANTLPTAEDFVSNLLALGNEVEIVMHAVHSMTSTIDSRHFAEEFLRRHKLADKGLVDVTKTSSPANAGAGQSGGWSEVAKKGPAKPVEEASVAGNFKVVAPKKKVSKR